MKINKITILLITLLLVLSYCLAYLTNNKIKSKKITKLLSKVNSANKIFKAKNTNPELDSFIKTALKSYLNREGKDQKAIVWKALGSNDSTSNFNQDVLVIFKTLFPENENYNQILLKDLKNESPEALKKLLFQIYLNKLYFEETENTILNKVIKSQQSESQIWPYPLAALVCHGGRTTLIFDKKKGFKMDELKKNLFVNPSLIKPRSAASHKLKFDEKTGNLSEKKIMVEAAWDWVESNFGKISHYGMNFPVGGVGNFWPDKTNIIGPEGFAVTKKTEKGKESFEKNPILQHGHMYLRFHQLHKSENFSSILFGLENEQPGSKGMFSTKAHNALSGITDSSTLTSVCGGVKWKKIKGIKIPANYGGKAVFLKKLDFNVFDKIEAFAEELKKKVWWIILSSNNQQFNEFYNDFLSKLPENVLQQNLQKLSE